MDSGSVKVLELALIVGVVGYFYWRQRGNLQRLKEEREAKRKAESSANDADADGAPTRSNDD